MFAVPLQESQPLAAFEQAARDNPSRFAVQEFSFSERSIDLAGVKPSGTATLQAGTRVPISFELVQENDQWKLISYSIGSRR